MTLADLLADATGEFVRIAHPAEHVRVLALNRPESMNSWHGPMRAEMNQGIEACLAVAVED